MCGIAGILRWDGEKPKEQEFLRLVRSMSHRGPDGEGMIIRDGLALGHRRLAIIDLETGMQPLSNEDETVWITYNGEIYNYRELRTILEGKGHQFRTRSDTEVIIHAYEEWDEHCVEKFRGMFAFGIGDFRRRKLFLARDHFGIKPLFYAHTQSYFAFASEIRAFRYIPDLALKLDIQAMDEYLCLQYIPAPRTVFKEIVKVPPAHIVSLGFNGTIHHTKRYWRVEFCPVRNRDRNVWLEELDSILRDSVRTHLVSDVPFGAFLSGGVDSSAIVAYMAEIMKEPVRTFSIGFEEQDFSELGQAQFVAERWKTHHHTRIVRPDALGILPKLVEHYGEPFGDSSSLPTYYVCQAGREHVPMVLSGDGGDEAFAGYDNYRFWVEWCAKNHVPKWKEMFYPVAHLLRPKRYPPRFFGARSWLNFVSPIPLSLRYALWREEYRSSLTPCPEVFETEFRNSKHYGTINKVQYMDLTTYLPYDILTKVDVASMMHGLEVRTPLVDVRVVEFAATIPECLNMSRSENGEWEGKLLLKKVMERYYPSDFLHRPKKGFGIPLQKWFAPGGLLQETLRDRLRGEGSPLNELFNPDVIDLFIESLNIYALWMLLFLEEWLRQNKVESSR
jgi:asparagine synthase (glutamine-hydrolysing)